MSGAVLLIHQRNRLKAAKALHGYFKDRNAFSEETGVELDVDSIANKANLSTQYVNPANFDFITVSPMTGKYHFDEHGYEEYLHKIKKGNRISMVVGIAIVLATILIIILAVSPFLS